MNRMFTKERIMTTAKPQTSDLVIDIYHGTKVSLQDVADAGIIGVIHKASEATHMFDKMYAVRRHEAAGLKLLWGAYHFASGDPVTDQVNHFIEAVQWGQSPSTDDKTLLCLDFEKSSSGPNMTVDQACDFVTQLHDKTKRWPMVYGGNILRDAAKAHPMPKNCPLSNCPFWLASYTAVPAKLPAYWSAYTLWQFTDGQSPQPVKTGSGFYDRERFDGTPDMLRSAWPVFANVTN